MGLGSQIGLLLWKNWLLQKRRICVSIFEIILPVISALIILAMRGLLTSDSGSLYHPRESVVLDSTYFPVNATIGYTPHTIESGGLMEQLMEMLQNRTVSNNTYSLRPFKSEDEAIDYVELHPDNMRHLIVFDNLFTVSKTLPKQLKYTIRPYTGDDKWNTELTYPFFQNGNPSSSSSLYKQRGVLYMQSLVAEAFARYWLKDANPNSTNFTNFEVYTNLMAYPPNKDGPLVLLLQSSLPFFLILSFIISVIINTKNLVYEKERKLKESMKLMGLTPAAHWISWFITFSIYIVPIMALYTILCSLSIQSDGPVLAHSDGSLFFVFLLCYALALVTFCFMISSFVQKANVGAAFSGIAFIVFYVPYFFIQPNYEGLSKGPKIAGSFLFNCAMALGANCIGMAEGTGEGAQWSNFHKPVTTEDNLSLLECMIMLLGDSAIHFLITWYMDNVMPGDFGIPKPFYFCFTKSYWCGGSAELDNDLSTEVAESKHFEKDPSVRVAGIRMCNLKKKYGRKVAVVGTTLNMYEGQITVLLGHNGAGKTTTMSMLTGFIPPTSGTAVVNGYDIRKNIAQVRNSLGLCPQHNILFDTLTVAEHLRFFAKLKGCSGPSIEKEVQEMVRKVGLEAKIYTSSQLLSGGQKRKLSVGIALIGGSKVVILDEPTSGMDPAARRQTWSVLQEARQNRTLVLSTHFMDEADVLGDRIAVMAGGVVKCCGSSMFLKKLYGTGYHLVVVKKPECDVSNLTLAVQSCVQTAQLETIINTEVTYLLPTNESSNFPTLFNYLETNKEKYGIISFGTTATTMEEVFIKVGEEEYERDDATDKPVEDDNNSLVGAENGSLVSTSKGYTNNGFQNEATNFSIHEETTSHKTLGTGRKMEEKMTMPDSDIMAFNKGFTKKTGLSLEISRFRGLFVKKAINSWRNFKVTLVQLLLPVLFTIVGLAVDEANPPGANEGPLTFDLSPFSQLHIPYTDGINATMADRNFAGLYVNLLRNNNAVLEYANIKDGLTFDNYTMDRATEMHVSVFHKEMVIGMELIAAEPGETIAAVAYYNDYPYHVEPISVNYLMNIFLQFTLNNSDYSLQSSIHPLPRDVEADTTSNNSAGFSIGFFVSFGMAFLTSCFIFFLIKERQVGAKHMQVLSGVGPVVYWIPTFLWDFIIYIIPSIVLVIVFAAFNKAAYIEDGRWGIVILVLAIYGWAVLSFIYAVQFWFISPPTGVVLIIVLSIVSGIVTTLVVLVLQSNENIANILDWVFMVIFPNYNLASSLSNIYTNYLAIEKCKPFQASCHLIASPCCKDNCGSFCVPFEPEYLSWDKPGIGAYLLFMTLQGVVFFTIVALIEYNILRNLRSWIGGSSNKLEPTGHVNNAQQAEDNDVAAERQRVTSSPASVISSSDSLVLIDLYKRYKQFVAVDHVCLGIPEQECFGLLGQNGAGKTTTFKMLTGDVTVTGGNAYLQGFDVRNNIKHVQANLGYCPQFDALLDQMTGRETLTMYARLRGIPEDNIKMVVNTIIDILTLRPHADKLAGDYSGGNKRKLSTGMALIGDPPFIMLDEPSSGMDPKARRTLWNILSQVRASGRTLVLTSHSMDECDALCTRIAIMVNGKFMCLGSPQHLKNKFGQGYTLIAHLGTLEDGRPAPNQPVIDYLSHYFPGSKVFDDHQGYVHFQVPDPNVKLADVFFLMEATKQNLHVDDYSVHQTTLEQIFLTFTRAQKFSE